MRKTRECWEHVWRLTSAVNSGLAPGVSAYVAQILRPTRELRREAAETYTRGNQSFLFLDMPLWAYLNKLIRQTFGK